MGFAAGIFHLLIDRFIFLIIFGKIVAENLIQPEADE